ncbi:hypothetical protein [Burkholderia aenigmatica]|uniref:hypothetical protein n=1 Tax=Burkholderia aenigmatica TaxID=2015348 RepID=UPI0015831CB6|nr:hypothetical protein [Burkholderia aenigmatica]
MPLTFSTLAQAPYVVGAGSGSGDTALPKWIGDLYLSATLNSSSGTNSVTLTTGAPYYYLTRLLVEFLPTCTTSGGGIVGVTFTDSAFGIVGAGHVWCPASFTASTSIIAPVLLESGAGYSWHASSPNSTLTVQLTAALTGGSVRVAVNGGLTALA